MTLDELEKEYLVSVLEETNWQKKKASAILGINASTLYRKIQRYGLVAGEAEGSMRRDRQAMRIAMRKPNGKLTTHRRLGTRKGVLRNVLSSGSYTLKVRRCRLARTLRI